MSNTAVTISVLWAFLFPGCAFLCGGVCLFFEFKGNAIMEIGRRGVTRKSFSGEQNPENSG